jgi:hypothetical protein
VGAERFMTGQFITGRFILSPKDIGNFRSARWQKHYTTDLSMMTQESADEDITTTRHIISNFPRKQHRPVIIHYGMRIPLMNFTPKPRNFLRAES